VEYQLSRHLERVAAGRVADGRVSGAVRKGKPRLPEESGTCSEEENPPRDVMASGDILMRRVRMTIPMMDDEMLS
jgi:hypothetical protein